MTCNPVIFLYQLILINANCAYELFFKKTVRVSIFFGQVLPTPTRTVCVCVFYMLVGHTSEGKIK